MFSLYVVVCSPILLLQLVGLYEHNWTKTSTGCGGCQRTRRRYSQIQTRATRRLIAVQVEANLHGQHGDHVDFNKKAQHRSWHTAKCNKLYHLK